MKELKTLRRTRGYTQAQRAAIIGVTKQAVALWETGARWPRAEDLPGIAETLNCSIDDLFGFVPVHGMSQTSEAQAG